MQEFAKLTEGNFYHIYNRGINSCNLFRESDNYEKFFDYFLKYVPPVADVYAFVFMPNHFHFLIKVIKETITQKKNNIETEVKISQLFSNLFNSYAQYYNRKYARHGSLFERPFQRKLITDENYLRTVILYIHKNPVEHGFTKRPIDYPWSSLIMYNTKKLPECCNSSAIELFGNKKKFMAEHKKDHEFKNIKNRLWL